MSDEPRAGALDGVRVVDLTTVLMGPYSTRMLADHGADVIRVESPMSERSQRELAGIDETGIATQRNKRNIVLDLKSDVGRAAMADLVASADVFVSNLRGAALERLDLDAATLRARHPALIHAVANGYDARGPHADRAAYDDAIQASSGIAGMFRRRDGAPAYVPTVIADKVCALFVAQAVLVALIHRRETGEGQTIEVPMFETMVGFNLVEHFRSAALDPPLTTVGYPRVLARDRRPYECADGWVAILPYSTANWRAFFELIGRPELIDDDRYATHFARIDHIDELYALIVETAPSRTVDQWLAVCAEHSIPASPVPDLADLVDDPQIVASGLIERVEHPVLGPYRSVRDATSFDSLSTDLRRHPPVPGQHTVEIMRELSWDDSRISELEAVSRTRDT